MADTAPARRHFIVEQDESGVDLDRQHSMSLFADLEALMASVGGTLIVSAQRAKIGDIGNDPVAVTTRLVIEWRAHSPLSLIDLTEPGSVEELSDALAQAAADAGELEHDDFELSPEELADTPPVAAGG